VETLQGNPTKAKEVLGWDPSETSFEQLVKLMVKHDLELAKNESTIKKAHD
jgi:GDPmannose 4,6-dehydratase